MSLVDFDFSPGSHGDQLAKVLNGMGVRAQLKTLPRSEVSPAGISLLLKNLTTPISVLPFGAEFSCSEVPESNSLLVVSLGVGVANPFRPQSVRELCPQSISKAVLVGTARSIAGEVRSSPFENYPEQKKTIWVHLDEKNTTKGSSYAAVLVAAAAECSIGFRQKIQQKGTEKIYSETELRKLCSERSEFGTATDTSTRRSVKWPGG